MTTRDVLNTWMSQVDGHGKNTILTFPNCQIVKKHDEVENLKLSEKSFSFDKSMSFVRNGQNRNIWLFSDQVKARDMNRADSALIWLDKGILNQQSCIFQQHNNSRAFCVLFIGPKSDHWLPHSSVKELGGRRQALGPAQPRWEILSRQRRDSPSERAILVNDWLTVNYRRHFEAENRLRLWCLILDEILKLCLVKILKFVFSRNADV